MSESQISMVLRRGVIILAFVVPVIFLRVGLDAFDLVKATTLWMGATLLLPLWIMLIASQKRPPTFLEKSLAVFVVATIVATAMSISPKVSLWGQIQRYNGLLTLVSGAALTAIVVRAFDNRNIKILVLSIATASAVVVSYSWLQLSGNDPFTWSITSFGSAPFGTMGNPNTASGFVAVTTPLLAWVIFSKGYPRLSFVAGFGLGGSLSMLAAFNSFQGSVAAVVTALVIVVFFVGNPGLQDFFLALPLGLGCLVLPNVEFSKSPAVVLLSAAFFGALVEISRRLPDKRFTFSTSKVKTGSSFALAGVLVLGLAFGRQAISAGFSGGFVERGDFYRAAVSNLRRYPLFGSGVETFGFQFTRFRPEGHAVRLEGSRTSSVHSVHLGMFSNGGLILGLAFLAIAIATAVMLVRRFVSSEGNDRMLLVGVGGAWIASHVQLLVSVEHVALLSTQFILTGMVWVICGSPIHLPTRRKTPNLGRSVLLGVGLFAALVLSVAVLTRPFRADIASRDGLVEANSGGNADFVRADFEKAIRLADWEPSYRLQMLQLRLALGQSELAADLAGEILHMSRYDAGNGVSLAGVLAADGRFQEAASSLELVLESDPFARGLRSNAARLYADMASKLREEGDSDRANEYLRRSVELGASS